MNHSYRVDQNQDEQPTVYCHVVQALDPAGLSGNYGVEVMHVLTPSYRRAFIPRVSYAEYMSATGSYHYGEDDAAWEEAAQEGREMADKYSVEDDAHFAELDRRYALRKAGS